MARHITERGISLIKKLEGFSNIMYLDIAGFATIGYGHLVKPNEKDLFKNGISESYATDLLKKDIIAAENAVIRLITVHLNNNQFDALVSFTFNLGAAALQRSSLRRKINREEHESIPAEFMRWIYAGGKKSSGLIHRRKLEAEVYSM